MNTQDNSRISVSALDDILGRTFSVLDSGFVRVVDYMGCDESIVQAARVSYGRGTKHLQEDRGLIRYLMRHRHTTPFEMCEIKFHVRVPMDCWRQWIRHRTANVNEYSTRYSEAIDATQHTPPEEWRTQSASNKQGSGSFLSSENGRRLSERESQLHSFAREVYDERLAIGVAREQARKDLPLSTYTEAYWKVDLHNLLHFLSLRMDLHAQQEIRDYATVIGNEVVSRWCPFAWEAFIDYRLNAMALSAIESEIVRKLSVGDKEGALQTLTTHHMLEIEDGHVKRNREREELEAKLQQLGVPAPWLR